MTTDGVAAIVLAAGRGSRFGEGSKLLAELDGKPLVRHVVDAARGAGLRPILLVTGHAAEGVVAAAGGQDLLAVRNPHSGEGLSTSLRAGFGALPDDATAAFVLLGDMPLVRPALLLRLALAWREAGEPVALVPVVGGRRGNPVLLSRRLAPEIARLTGDTGAGPLLRGRADVVEIAVDDPALAVDVDTQASLATLRQAAKTTPSSTAP